MNNIVSATPVVDGWRRALNRPDGEAFFGPHRSWLREQRDWLSLTLFCLAIPFFLLLYEQKQARLDGIAQSRAREFSRLEQLTCGILRREKPGEYLSLAVRRVFIQALVAPNFGERLVRGIKRLHQRFPGLLELTGRDENGDILFSDEPGLRDDPATRTTLDVLWHYYLHRQPASALKQHWPAISRLLGPQITLEQILARNEFLITAFLPREQWFSLQTAPRGLLLARYAHPELWENWMLNDVVSRARRLQATFPFHLRVVQHHGSERLPPDLTGSPTVSAGRNRLIVDGSLVAWFPAGVDHFLVASCTDPLVTTTDTGGFLFFWGGLMVCGVLSLCLHPWFHASRAAIPLRGKLSVWFGLAGLLPLLFLLVFTRSYLRQSREDALSQMRETLNSRVKSIDERFDEYLQRLEVRLNRHWQQLPATQATVTLPLVQTLKKTAQLLADAEGFLYDRQGKLVRRSAPFPASSRGGVKILESLSRTILATRNREPVPAHLDIVGVLLETLPFSRNPLFEILRQLQRIAEYSWANDQSVSYLTTLLNSSGTSEYLVILFTSRARLYRSFLLNELRYATPGRAGADLMAYHVPKNQWIRRPGRRSPPLYWLVQKLRAFPDDGGGEFWYAGRRYWATGLQSARFPEFCLLGVTPLDVFQEQERRALALVIGFVLCLAGFVLFCGKSLASALLQPLTEIDRGIRGLRARDFSVRLEATTQDEMGDLVQTMNRTLAGMAELEVAKKIQDFFLPAGTVALGDWAAHGRTVQMAGLGGDYFEIKPLPPTHLLAFLGDVSGHGVPAALIMAMAKVLVEDGCSRPPDLPQLARSLNTVILSNFRRKWMMTGMFILIDTDSHRVCLLNAGHPQALHIRHGEVFQEWGRPGFPLGVRAEPDYPPDEFVLEAGDTLIVFSDGLLEAHQPDGEPIGTTRLRATLPGLLAPTAAATCERIFSWFAAATAGSKAEDDVSVLVITRRALVGDTNFTLVQK
jgi:hypothetical protein